MGNPVNRALAAGALALLLSATAAAAEGPARAEHPLVISATAGWNGLAGLGAEVCWRVLPGLYADAAAGYVISGPKGGIRVRWDFSESDGWVPFAAVGVVHSLGNGSDQTIGKPPFTFHNGPATFAQALVGLDNHERDSRLVWRWAIGWSQLVGTHSLFVISGHPDDASWREVKLIAGGGLIVEGAVGWAL